MQKSADSQMEPLSKSLFAELKKLQQKKYRKAEGQVPVEGKNLVEQLLDNGRLPLMAITSESETAMFLQAKGVQRIYQAKPHEISRLADTETPQDLVCIYPIPSFTLEKYRILLYLDGIQDPGNLGTIFRTSAAFNIDGIVLSPDCCEVFSPKVIRASLGSVFWHPSKVAGSEWLSLQEADKTGLAVSGGIGLKDFEFSAERSLIIVMGSEGSGIRPEVERCLDRKVTIHIAAEMESLNVSVTTGIVLYEIYSRFMIDTQNVQKSHANIHK